MAMVEGGAVVLLLGLLVYGVVLALTRPSGAGPAAVEAGRWEVAHYDREGVTRVVVQKVAPGSARVVDEHVVATIPVDTPGYDDAFLTAMAVARQRRALFEVEDRD